MATSRDSGRRNKGKTGMSGAQPSIATSPQASMWSSGQWMSHQRLKLLESVAACFGRSKKFQG